MKLKLLLLYSIHTTYGRIQMTDMLKSVNETSMAEELYRGRQETKKVFKN